MGTVSVTGVSKSFKRYESQWARFFEWIDPRGRSRSISKCVLNDVTFTINSGESVGIIGVNGAGKSTLLKLLVGTISPTSGSIQLGGSVSALLELGMGFHPDFTGRENVYTSGQLLGLTTGEIHEVLAEIENFAEIGEYIDQPVRVYSSGMQMRLAFAVATCKRPDILIVDEAFSVGDSYFQHKCTERIRQFQKLGTTFLFVSHSPDAIKSICSRAILLNQGAVMHDGKADEVMEIYNSVIVKDSVDQDIRKVEGIGNRLHNRFGDRRAEIIEVEFLSHGAPMRAIAQGDDATLRIKFKINTQMQEITIGMLIRDKFGNDVFGTNSYHLNANPKNLNSDDIGNFEFQIPHIYLGIGNYSISVALHSQDTHVGENYDWWDRALVFNVIPGQLPQAVGNCNLPVTPLFSLLPQSEKKSST